MHEEAWAILYYIVYLWVLAIDIEQFLLCPGFSS